MEESKVFARQAIRSLSGTKGASRRARLAEATRGGHHGFYWSRKVAAYAIWAVAAVLLAGSAAQFLAGCGSNGESVDAPRKSEERAVTVLEVETPLRAPIWSPDEKALFALGQDGRNLVKVDVTGGGFTPDEQRPEAVASSQGLEGTAGENLALEKDREPDKIYVPIPDRGEVSVRDKDDLLEVRTFEAGESSSRVALYPSSDAPRNLLVLSKDGSTVTVVDLLAEKEVAAKAQIEAGESSLIETGAGGGFWVAGSGGVGFYGGPPFERRASARGLEAVALAADVSEPARAYAAVSESGRVVAIELGQKGNLEVVEEAEVGGRVTHLAVEKGRLYALMPGKTVVLDTKNLKTLETVDFDRSLDREALKRAEPSGLAVGEDALYLTLEGEPVLVQIQKP